MIAVAAFALVLGGVIEGGRLARRARAYQQTGEAFQRHATEALREHHEALSLADSLDRSAVIQAASPDLQESARNAKTLAEFHRETARLSGLRAAYNARLAEKYEYASRHPWLPVEPNAPPP
jgi:uncharacterized membrane protein YccC